MSSLQKTKTGYRIQFRYAGKTKQLGLPGAKRKAAEQVQRHVDELLSAKRYGTSVEASTLSWLQACDKEVREKLEQQGLIEPAAVGTTLGEQLTRFLQTREGKADSTYKNYVQVDKRLRECFGPVVDPIRLTFADADRFRSWCLDIAGLGENTTRKRCSQAATFWRWMMRHKAATQNIFEDVPKSVGSAIDRKPFVEAATITQLLTVVTDPEWRALIVLGRYGGLRVPSEPFAMEWQDVDWERGQIVVNSRKTAHQNKPRRTIPLFSELEPELMSLAESQEKGATFCFPRLREKSGNVREPLEKMIRRAKLEPWSNLWNSLRSTRETELAATFPIHVVCEWMGNTTAVAMRNYLKATPADFDRARAPKNAPKVIAGVKGD